MYEKVILSGGGTKGLCILGALQYLQDTKQIDCSAIKLFVGTSIGSVISYFLAIGYTPIELVVYLCSHHVLESFTLNGFDGILKGDGIYNYSVLTKVYQEMTHEKMDFIPTLRDIKERFSKELVMCTYNFTKRKKEYISYRNYPDLSCLDAIRMSSNLPFIFSPFWYNGCEYIDGGIVENFSFSSIPFMLENENKEKDKNNEENKEKDRNNEESEENKDKNDEKDKNNEKSEENEDKKDKKDKNNEETKEKEEKYKEILGICLTENEVMSAETIVPKKKEEDTYNRLTAILDKVYDILIIPISEYENLLINKYRDQIDLITIRVENIKIYTFQISQQQKLELFSLGYNRAKEIMK